MGKTLFRLLGLLLALCVVTGLIYISLLGENDRATDTVKTYFDNIAHQRYDANAQLCSRRYNKQFNNLNDPITQQFSLETALLNHFGLIGTAAYTTDAKRDGFWIPFLSDAKLHVSIEIRPKDSNNIISDLFVKNKNKYIKNLVTLIRENGAWKIDEINTRSSAIAKDYQKTRKAMQHSKYIQQTANGLTIKANSINFTTLRPIEKRILIFNLNKALSLLNAHK